MRTTVAATTALLIILSTIPCDADEDQHLYIYKCRMPIKYANFYSLHEMKAIRGGRLAFFSRGAQTKNGAHQYNAILGHSATLSGRATKPGIFFKGIGAGWGAYELEAIWPGLEQGIRRLDGLLFAAIMYDYDGSSPYFAMHRFNQRARPVGGPVIIHEVSEVNDTYKVHMRDAWIAAAEGPDSIGVALSYVLRDTTQGTEPSDYRSEAYFLEFDFQGNQIGELRKIKLPSNGVNYEVRVFRPAWLEGRWLIPASGRNIQGTSTLVIQNQLFIGIARKKGYIRARTVEVHNFSIGVNSDLHYSSLQFLSTGNQGVAPPAETLMLFVQKRNFKPKEKKSLKFYDSEYYIYEINKRGRIVSGPNKHDLPAWIPKMEETDILNGSKYLGNYFETITNAAHLGSGKYMFAVLRSLSVFTKDKYQFETMEGDMGLYILDLPTSKISTEGVGLFSDYYYSRLSDDVLKDFVAVGQKDRFVLLEGSLEQGYDEDRKNWIDTVVIEKSEFATRPASRADHALASSSQDQMIYVFGGADGGKHYKDFWVWNSKENYWREVEDSNGPEGRSRHAMVYDSKRNVLVLFGGKTKKKALGDTWEWDGAKWTSFGTSKVNPREGHAMVYDVESGVVLLFGGRNGSKFYNDLWSWDGFSWKRLSRKGLINPRAEHAMAYDRKQNVVVVFGGFDGTDILGDTWQYDGDDWTLMKAEEMWIDPSARQGAAAVYDESHSQVMLIGGIDRDGHVKDDAYRWDGVEWDRLYIYPTTRIPARTGHAVAFEPKERCVLVFGGWAKGEVNGETWLWDGLDWFNIMP